MKTFQFGILISSDSSSRGERPDSTTPLLQNKIEELGWVVVNKKVVPDESSIISKTLSEWADNDTLDVILTSGGTGFARRDVTPEATALILDKQAPGLAEAMRAKGLLNTAHAMLSRGIAGIRKTTIIVNLPGNPSAALEGFLVIVPVIPHAVELLRNSPSARDHSIADSHDPH